MHFESCCTARHTTDHFGMSIALLRTNLQRRLTAALFAAVLLTPGMAAGQGSQFVEVISMADLDFGAVARHAGTVEVGKGYTYLGKFKVRARMVVPLGTYPEVDLTFTPSATLDGPSAGVPYDMAASYNNQTDDPISSTSISGTTARIELRIDEGTENGIRVYSAYVYVYGAITVGSQPSDNYAGFVNLEATAVFTLPPECFADAWERRQRYYPGDLVTHAGAAWAANRFTIGNEPGKAHDWEVDDDEEDDDDRDGDEDRDEGDGRDFDDDHPGFDEDDDRGRGRGGNTGRGEPGGGRPWDLLVHCE